MIDTGMVYVTNYQQFRVDAFNRSIAFRALAFHYNLNDSEPAYRAETNAQITAFYQTNCDIVTLFNEVNSADVCECEKYGTRVRRVISRLYDAELNEFRVLKS